MGRLDGKIAIITGAGSGIARAATRIFAREGAKVVVAEIDTTLGEASAKAVRDGGGEAVFVRTDVTDEPSVKRMVQAALDSYGGLDVLFNCAGGSVIQDTAVTEVDMGLWDHTMNLDLKGPFLCCRHGVPAMLARGKGTIVNVSSVVALKGNFPPHIYIAAKGGIIAFTKALAGTYSAKGIRANAICPGVIMTDRVKSRVTDAKTEVPNKDRANRPPGTLDRASFGRYPFGTGEPEDIANIALFLASDESRMINGAAIPAEGGMSAY